jgi:predicted nucleic acid-binding protein
MGRLSCLHGRKIYVDANIFIYAVNGTFPYEPVLHEIFRAIEEGQMEAVTSELTVLEVLVIPLRRGDPQEEERCRQILAPRSWLCLIPVSLAILESAARLRASAPGLHTPDAIHLATAAQASCDVFLTNDHRLRSEFPLTVLLLEDLLVQ